MYYDCTDKSEECIYELWSFILKKDILWTIIVHVIGILRNYKD